MITLVFAWGISGLVIGATGSRDVLVIGLILVGMAAAMWVVKSLYTGWLQNRNASQVLAASESRRHSGGAV